jgi:hypothetical protein
VLNRMGGALFGTTYEPKHIIVGGRHRIVTAASQAPRRRRGSLNLDHVGLT